MEFNTKQLNGAIFNALMLLTEKDKQSVVEAFDNAMNHMDCEHKVCKNIGKDIADLIDNEDWQGLSDFLDHVHMVEYGEEVAE